MCCYVNSLVQVSHGPRPSTTKTINSWLFFVCVFLRMLQTVKQRMIIRTHHVKKGRLVSRHCYRDNKLKYRVKITNRMNRYSLYSYPNGSAAEHLYDRSFRELIIEKQSTTTTKKY